MGILAKKQAEQIKVQRSPQRRYVVPKKEKVVKIYPVARVLKTVQCRVCYKRVDIENAVLVEGGGTQGHRSFFLCERCI